MQQYNKNNVSPTTFFLLLLLLLLLLLRYLFNLCSNWNPVGRPLTHNMADVIEIITNVITSFYEYAGFAITLNYHLAGCVVIKA
jgi:hypothetical protein